MTQQEYDSKMATLNAMQELINIQRDLRAPKTRRNNFGVYRSCEDILEAVKPLLAENGCVLTIYDDIVEVGGRIYVKATATLVNASGDVKMTTAYAREDDTKKGMDGAQVTGAASSYARKYALNGLFCIDDVADADGTNTHGKDDVKPAKKESKPSAVSVEELTPKASKKTTPWNSQWNAGVGILQSIKAAKGDTIREKVANAFTTAYDISDEDCRIIEENILNMSNK